MGSLLPPPRRFTRVWALVLAVPFLAGLAALTLTPSRIEQTMPNLLDVVLGVAHRLGWSSLDFTRLEIIANILVFVPVGILAFVLLPRRVWLLALLAGPVLSVAIETAQRVALPHRAATVTDVLANSAGAVAGVALAVLCTVLIARRDSQDSPSRLEAS
ncbi:MULTISPECIES: VanZ family protein [unclassified Microbacterium]|uniref:VanZ family protein n=1 Tax=unclassified Microbacterium TaxID=2609290 RepID=UPI0016050893|nr:MULTISPECIES: VanZ family protein [unclassified Microbacterium]QNA93319.1 VanZ family protein [Microbacterium sp. Se63.02b]QYM63536.1 VanZ family protein [Microbacterium sp. Se5.02b]